MEDKRQFSSAANSAMLLPRSALRLLKDAGSAELKALIYICACDGCFDNAELCEACGITQTELQSAISFWRGAKVLRLGSAEAEIPAPAKLSKVRTMQEYDTEVLSDAKLNNKDFAAVCYVCERAFEKHTLTRNDLNTLYYLYSFVGLPFDLLCAIIENCALNEKRSMQYLVKTALGLYEEYEIDTYEKYDEYLERRKIVTDSTSQLRTLLGIGNRSFTTNEKQYIERWFGQRQYAFELIRYAYDLTVDAIGKFSFKYADAILERWYSEGITTLDGAIKQRENYKSSNSKENNDSFDFDEFVRIASNRKLT